MKLKEPDPFNLSVRNIRILRGIADSFRPETVSVRAKKGQKLNENSSQVSPTPFILLQGGKFGNGFVSAGVSAAVGGSSWFKGLKHAGSRIFAKAVLGGTISEITGGKFANGAATAAMFAVAGEAGGEVAMAKKADRELSLQSIPEDEWEGLLQKAFDKLERKLNDPSKFESPELQSKYKDLYENTVYSIDNTTDSGYDALTRGRYTTIYGDAFKREYYVRSDGTRRYEPMSRVSSRLARTLAHELRHQTPHNKSLGTRQERVRALINDEAYRNASFEKDANNFSYELMRNRDGVIRDF